MTDRSKRESWMPQAPNRRDNRYSVSSFATQASYEPSEIGEAVSVPVQEQRGDSGEVKQMYVNKKDDDSIVDEEGSLFSESQAQIGRLDTIKRRSQTEIRPEMTVQTELKATVPPRSRRRPVSEITPRGHTATDFVKAHHPRVSLNISDDLDKLMESVNDLKLTDNSNGEESKSLHSSNKSISSGPPAASRLYSSEGIQKTYSGASVEHAISGTSQASSGAKGKVQNMNFSTDSFETAEGHSTVESSGSDSPSRFVLPKRPNEANMRKARQASANHAQHLSAQNQSNTSRSSSVRSKPNLSHSVASIGEEHSSQTLQGMAGTGNTGSTVLSISGDQDILDTTSSRYVSSDAESGRSVIKSSNYKPSPHKKNSLERNFEDDSPVLAEHSMMTAPIQKEITPLTELEAQPIGDTGISSLKSNDLGIGSTESIGADLRSDAEPMGIQKSDGGSNHTGEIPKEVLLKKQLSIERKENAENALNDDDFYDIEEPVLVNNPVRPKSVKRNTRKSTKRKSKHVKKKDASGGRLKPFSYNTLVHLLESINGSVIGEEFESLNLPMREKQLIEKIVDSLSRLTSDMVIDENRYEVGIDRLERAHRVLEGFL